MLLWCFAWLELWVCLCWQLRQQQSVHKTQLATAVLKFSICSSHTTVTMS
jgi:hypothetical protein